MKEREERESEKWTIVEKNRRLSMCYKIVHTVSEPRFHTKNNSDLHTIGIC